MCALLSSWTLPWCPCTSGPPSPAAAPSSGPSSCVSHGRLATARLELLWRGCSLLKTMQLRRRQTPSVRGQKLQRLNLRSRRIRDKLKRSCSELQGTGALSLRCWRLRNTEMSVLMLQVYFVLVCVNINTLNTDLWGSLLLVWMYNWCFKTLECAINHLYYVEYKKMISLIF